MSDQATAATGGRAIAQSIREYGRGVAGGLLFSLPLLYTMEMWQSGFVLAPLRLLIGLAMVFLLLLGYNRYAGVRSDASFWEVAIDSIEELGLGLNHSSTSALAAWPDRRRYACKRSVR